MTFEEIEQCLGLEIVADVQASIQRAFIASRQKAGENGEEAMEELLLAMLISVVQPQKDAASSMHCVRHLRSALKKIHKELEAPKR